LLVVVGCCWLLVVVCCLLLYFVSLFLSFVPFVLKTAQERRQRACN
jgi:hypothetical protein